MTRARWWDNNIWACARYRFSVRNRRVGWQHHPSCVLDLDASRPGELFATVGDEEVFFALPAAPAAAWAAVAVAAAAQPRLRAALLKARLPDQIRRHLYNNGITLEWDVLPPGRCSCGAWPCAHACAVVYRLSTTAQEAPMSVLPLYGCDLAAFREILQEAVSAASDWGDSFWDAPHPLPRLAPVSLPDATARLGPVGVQALGADLAEHFKPLYARLCGDEE